jgi:hypothetical protein
MTADRAALLEKVAKALQASELAWLQANPGTVPEDVPYDWQATAAISLIRAEVLEEAAKVADENLAWDTAADLRALKEKP